MAKIMHTCVTCGKEYEACDYCDKHSGYAQGWRRVACCPEHYQAHIIYVEWREGRMDTEDAALRLDDLGIEQIGRLNVRECMQAKKEVIEEAKETETQKTPDPVVAEENVESKKRSSKKKVR